MFEMLGGLFLLAILGAIVLGPWIRMSQLNNRLAESQGYVVHLRRDHDLLATEVHLLRSRVDGMNAAIESLKERATSRGSEAPAPVTPIAEQAVLHVARVEAELHPTPPPLPAFVSAIENLEEPAKAESVEQTMAPPAIPVSETQPIFRAQDRTSDTGFPPPRAQTGPVPQAPPQLLHAFAEEAKSASNWEELIGGNLLNKLGALVLVIGIALFLSYSLAHMGAPGRAATGAGVSFAMLAGGLWRERNEKYRVFARGLIAAGWASLYFTSYAIYAIPATKIIDSPVAGALLMITVAAAMVAHSLRYKVQALTALAYGCVFAALALSDLTLFAVVALVPLAASILFLARRFEWYEMALFGAAATYATFLSRPDMGTPLMTVQAILLVFWAMFEGFDLFRVASRQAARTVHHAFFAVNAIAGLGASAMIWYRKEPGSMWQFCAGAAFLYLISTILRILLDEQSLYEASLAISTLLAGLAIFARVQGIWISIGLLMEAEILFLAGVYLRLRLARVLSLLGFTWSVAQLALTTGSTTVLGAQVDNWAPPLVLHALAFYGNRWIAKGASYFTYFASAFLAIVLGYELPWRYAGGTWLVLGVILFETGYRRKLPEFRFQGYALSVLGGIAIGLNSIDSHYWVPWVHAAATVLFIGSALRARFASQEFPEPERLGMRGGGWIGAALLTAAALRHEVSGGMLTLSLGIEGLALLGTGFAARERMLRLSGLALLLGCILKLFLYDLRNLETMFRILSFIGLGVILLAVSWIYTRFKDEIRRYL